MDPSHSATQYPQQQKRWKFDPTINLGNILTILAITVGGLLAWSKMEARVTTQEDNMTRVQIVIEKQTAILQEQQISNTRLSTLLDVYIPEIEGLKKDQDAEIIQGRQRGQR